MHAARRNTNSFCCRKGLKRGLLFNTQKWTVQGDPCADKTSFHRKGHLGKWIRRTATQPAVSSFTVMWLVSGRYNRSHSWLRVIPGGASLMQDGFQAGAFWEVIMGWSRFSFGSFPDSASCVSSLFVLHSSVGLSVVRLTHANRYIRRFWSVLPLIILS